MVKVRKEGEEEEEEEKGPAQDYKQRRDRSEQKAQRAISA
jgi:hypothetical protein